MKELNTYIIEKLRIDKNTKVDLSYDAKLICNLFQDYPKPGIEKLKGWFNKYDVISFTLYIAEGSNYDKAKKYTHDFFENTKFKNSRLIKTRFKFIYDNEYEGKERFEIVANEYGLLLNTYWFEILISIE